MQRAGKEVNLQVCTTMRNKLHARSIAKALDAPLITTPTKADWVVVVGGSAKLTPFIDTCHSLGSKVCVYWMGTDVFQATKNHNWQSNFPIADLHVTVHDRTTEELKSQGVPVETAYFFTPRTITRTTDRPNGRIAIYMPNRASTYNFEKLRRLAKENKHLNFTFYGSASRFDLPRNCRQPGRLTPEECTNLLASHSTLIRWTRHDGFPQNIIEAQMLGREVIASYPYPGCWEAKNLTEVGTLLRSTLTYESYQTGWSYWYQQNCTPTAFRQRMFSLMKG